MDISGPLTKKAFRRHVEIEADTLEQAIEKAEADIDLAYCGCATPDWDTNFKPDLNWNKK